MNRPLVFWITIAVGCVAGFCCACSLAASGDFRGSLAEFFDRGRLLGMVDGRGFYQVDLSRKLSEATYVAGLEEGERTDVERNSALAELIADSAAQSQAPRERVSSDELKRQMDILRFEFGDDKTWNAALRRSHLSRGSLARMLSTNLKARQWVSRRIATEVSVTADECRKFYDSHLEQFFVPERRNVSHLFLAAPPETAADVVDKKKAAIEVLSGRLAAGEDFASLAAQNSEDDATKLRGGELGYFSAKRMPPDFVEAASKLRPGEISKPVRTRLGFHILKLTDLQAPRQQTFDEVRGDIAVEIANQKRQGAVQKLSADLVATASYLQPL